MRFSEKTTKERQRLVRRLKKLMKDNDLTGADVASLLGVHRTAVYGWVNGKSLPTGVCFENLKELVLMGGGRAKATAKVEAPDPAPEESALDKRRHSVQVSLDVVGEFEVDGVRYLIVKA